MIKHTLMKRAAHCKTTLALVLMTISLNGQWVQQAGMKGAPRSGAVSWVLNNKLYVVGGGPAQNLQEYDPATNTWTNKAALPWATARYLAIGFVINDQGYICTGTDGINGIYYNDLWMYDPFLDAWTAKASFPGAPRVLGFAFSIGDNAYVGAGGDNFLFYSDMYAYNSISDSWTAKANYPGGISVQHVSTGLNGFGYVGGGVEYVASSNNFVNTSDMYRYAPSIDTWSLVTSIPGPPRLSGVAFASANRIYAGLGTNSQIPTAGSIYKDVYSYDPVANVWDTLPDLPVGRAYATGVFLGGKPYVATGRNTGTAFSDLWALQQNLAGLTESAGSQRPAVVPTIVNGTARLQADGRNTYSIIIYDLSGKKVLEYGALPGNSVLDCRVLDNGLYFVEINSGSETVNSRIIISQQ